MDSRDVEDIRNELDLKVGVPVERAPGTSLVQRSVEQHPRPANDRVERRANSWLRAAWREIRLSRACAPWCSARYYLPRF
jgi:hypothetical protein